MERIETSETENSEEGCSAVDIELLSRRHACIASLKTEIKEALQEQEIAPNRVPSIWRVPPELRSQDPEAYEPKVVSIGPLHHGKKNLIAMDKIKLEILGQFLHLQPDNTLEIFIDEVFPYLGDARIAYSEKIELTDEEFAKLLVIDGCFLILYCTKTTFFDFIDWSKWTNLFGKSPCVDRDLWLLENQLPFWVVDKLFRKFCIIFPKLRDHFDDCVDMTLNIMRIFLPPENSVTGSAVNFLEVVCISMDPRAFPDKSCDQSFWEKVTTPVNKIMHLISVAFFGLFYLILFRDCSLLVSPPETSQYPPMIPTATELQEAGIKFQMKVNRNYISDFQLNVSWRDGTILIPQLTLESMTFLKLKNLIAFEQSSLFSFSSHLTYYCLLLDNLINTPEDVRILRQSGILVNTLGSDSEVADMVNCLCKEVILWESEDPYKELREKVVMFCQVSHHKWRAILVRNYFQSPWTIFSLLAAIILVGFTITQTFFTIYPRK